MGLDIFQIPKLKQAFFVGCYFKKIPMRILILIIITTILGCRKKPENDAAILLKHINSYKADKFITDTFMGKKDRFYYSFLDTSYKLNIDYYSDYQLHLPLMVFLKIIITFMQEIFHSHQQVNFLVIDLCVMTTKNFHIHSFWI